MNKSIIGITLDWEDQKTYSQHSPWYALRDNYIKAVIKAGATPILIPYDNQSLNIYADMIDGLLIPGGDYDLDPKHYNEIKKEGTRNQKEDRVEFEVALLKAVINQKKPILGICAGMQLIAVKIGNGSLIQDISSEIQSSIEHEQSKNNIPHNEPAHKIIVNKDSLLFRITKTEEFFVNSTHHQAVKNINDDFIISAVAEDGIIEAIEAKNYPFMVGVEWHPEYHVTECDIKIFNEFIKAASK